jgi:hypothetical protein
MDKQERYQELRHRLSDFERKNVELAAEIAALGATRESVQDEALKAELLAEAGWKDRRAEAERNFERWQKLKAEEETGIRAVGILKAELGRLADDIAEDIRGQFRQPFEKAMKGFVVKLRDALSAETRVRDVLGECGATFAGLGIDLVLGVERPLGLEWSGPALSRPSELEELAERILARCKLNLINVE